MQPNKPQSFRLPQRFDSPTLAKLAIPGEPTVIVRAVGVGSTAPFEYSDRNGRQAIFRYEREYDAHVLKVPASVWNHNKGFMAHELMDQRRLPHPLVVTVEVPAAEATSPIKGLIDAMKADPEYAWGWHCNLAMAMHDSGAGPHQACNRGAALFLSLLSDGAVDTTQHPAYENTQGNIKPVNPTAANAETIKPWIEALGLLSTLAPSMDINVDDPVGMAKTIIETVSKSQDGQEAKSSGPYPENAGASPAPATTSAPSVADALGIEPMKADESPEMDAPGNSEEASDVVVGQVSEQPGASSTFSGPGLTGDEEVTDEAIKAFSSFQAPTGNAPAPLYSRAWDMLESPMRLKELAATLEADPDTLKASIQDPLSTVELGHAGWVKRREPQA